MAHIYTLFSRISFFEKLQAVSVSADTDVFPFIELGDRIGQGARDAVVAVATKQDHWGEFSVLRDPFTLHNIYDHIGALLRISRLIVVEG